MPDIRESVPETHRDLLEAPRTAAVTTIGADGCAQTTAVWFLLDDDGRLKFTRPPTAVRS